MYPCTIFNDLLLFVHFLGVGVDALRHSQQFFSHVMTFSWVEPVLSNKDEVPCSRT